MKQMQETDNTDSSSKDNVVEAKHYLIFIVHSATGGLLKTTLARYGVETLPQAFICNELKAIIQAINGYNLSVVAISADGASEARAALKLMATLTVNNLVNLGALPSKLKEDKLIPKDLQLAMWNPLHMGDLLKLIWIHSDMPHAIKKFVNVLELSSRPRSKRNMVFRLPH